MLSKENAAKKERGQVAVCSSFLVVLVLMLFMTDGLCVWKGVFGLPCPGCGGTRAMFLLAKGNILGSLKLNPSAPLLFLCLLNEIRVNYFKRGSKKVAAIFLLVSVLFSIMVYIIRMKYYFPSYEPYIFNDQCLLLRLLNMLFFHSID